MNEKTTLFIKVLLCLAAAATTAYLLMLGCYNTLSLDDYGFAVDMRTNTPYSWMKQMYMTWQGRFSDFLVSGIVFKLFSCHSSLWVWTIIHLALGYLVVGLYIKNVVKVNDSCLLFGITILLTNVAICSVFELRTFYWLCCAGYFLVIYATLLLIYVLFFAQWKLWLRYMVAIVSSVYISGSAENYTPLVLLVLGVIWLLNIMKDAKGTSFAQAFGKHQILFVVCAILGIGFLAMLFAPGNKVRMNQGGQIVGFMHQFVLVPFIKKTIVANFVFGLRLFSRGLYVLGVLPLALWIGAKMKENNEVVKVDFVWKRVLWITIGLIGFTFVAVTSCVYGIGYYPPLRSMEYMLFVVMVWVTYCGVLLGYCYAEKCKRCFTCLAVLCLCMWIGYGSYFFIKEQPAAKHYYEYITSRDAKIKQLAMEGNTEAVTIEPLTLPRWLNTYSYVRNAVNRCVGSKKVIQENYFPYMTSDLCDNPDDFKNKGLQQYYNADFEIYGYATEYK